ncbi:MAG: hypothetical protein R3F41_12510 [Gammaproteobacteria bacterium]|nr:hypothetical protein [Pseudomonadales bacterium]MCP5348920.1 hypothetical protein [Pseudomonadales bacterium]
MNYYWHDLVGNLGVTMIVLAYLGLQIGRLDSRSLTYSLANGAGAALILVSLYFNFNLSSFLIEIVWLIVSIVGIVLNLRRR